MKNQYPIFYTFRRWPYAIRARLALGLAKIDVERDEEGDLSFSEDLTPKEDKSTVWLKVYSIKLLL